MSLFRHYSLTDLMTQLRDAAKKFDFRNVSFDAIHYVLIDVEKELFFHARSDI